VGGGFAGAYCARTLARAVGSAAERRIPRVGLIHSRPHLLAEIGEKLGDEAQRVLEPAASKS
jgi:NADH dehydrogenase FAD-containing subunit